MIRWIGELLAQLRKAEADRLDKRDIRHAPTIGAMYEGVTKYLLNKAIPDGLDLKIVSGFVIDGKGGSGTGTRLVDGSVRQLDGTYEFQSDAGTQFLATATLA
ncbi:hypothetical protein [Agrobacterium vitis]|uniref:hypothetical protein n=1 Tax=Agrobacterium vitis TaxID=373 RepID=UPI0008DC224E|nr:hypothetical protein [Agrobacterium vitis]MUO85210.1 hypothetical protein [Agrobacterium vitis]